MNVPTTRIYPFIIVLFAASGMASLIYEVLWLKDISRILGSSSLGAAVTVAVFFSGLAAGGYVCGKIAPRVRQPLLMYAILEVCIALGAVWYMVSVDFATHSLITAGSLTIKTLISFIILFPPAFFMGGTFPVIAQAVLHTDQQKKYGTTLLYNSNILGAVLGAFLAGFALPPLVGYKVSFFLAIVLNGVLAAAAWYVSNNIPKSLYSQATLPVAPPLQPTQPSDALPIHPQLLICLLFVSGFGTLALQIAWTRMFSQVTTNDIYSFSAILVVFLLCLMAGAVVAQWLQRRTYPVHMSLSALLGVGGLSVVLSPFVFNFVTRGLSGAPGGSHWLGSVFGIFLMVAVSIALPIIILGTVFPYLLGLVKNDQPISVALGRMLAVNTTGSIIGPLMTGFILLPVVGLYRTIVLLGCMYMVAAIVLLAIAPTPLAVTRGAVLLALLVVVGFLFAPKVLGEVKLRPKYHEKLLSLRHGHGGSIAVINGYGPQDDPKGPGDTYMRLNNTYTLGGVGALSQQERQTQLAFWLHPEAKDVFYVGLATGTTAGASLYYPVRHVTVCELLPEVVTAAKRHFSSYSHGLYTDKRVSIVAEDGRTCLAADARKYDLIISDLFNPAHAGTGSLYTRETFSLAQQRLHDDGVFVQWLPLYQLSEQDFGTIARTMMKVFPQVTLWRGNFAADQPAVALVGQQKGATLDPKSISSGLDSLGAAKMAEPAVDALLSVKPGDRYNKRTAQEKAYIKNIWPQLSRAAPYTFYVGNLTAKSHDYQYYPLNTDDRPVIEFNAPKNRSSLPSMTRLTLMRYFEKHFPVTKSVSDPYLKQLTSDQLRYIQAGADYYAFFALQQQALLAMDQQAGKEAKAKFRDYLQKIDITPQ